jgi:hypothetical protein
VTTARVLSLGLLKYCPPFKIKQERNFGQSVGSWYSASGQTVSPPGSQLDLPAVAIET